MLKVQTIFENCYGIKKLSSIFDFTEKSTYAVYSPNGTMKTSFSKTFMDFSKNKDTVDLVFPERVTTRSIQDENSLDVNPECVFVIEPYNEAYKSDKLSTLLVNSELKERYDSIHNSIDTKKERNYLKSSNRVLGLGRISKNLFPLHLPIHQTSSTKL